MKIAFLGLGRMGQGMAKLLVAAGYELNVYRGRTESLVDAGARESPSAADAVADRDVVITMLPSDSALRSLVTSTGGLLESMQPGATHVAMGDPRH